MRKLGVLLVVLVLGRSARAETADTVRSYWNATHSAILSDVVVTHDDGSVEARQVLGGSVDGVGMVQIPIYGPGVPRVDYVRTTNRFGSKLHWGGSCVFITVDSAGTQALTFDQETQAIQQAMDAWNQQPDCSYLRYMMTAPETLEVGYDGKNVIKFRDEKWCRPDLCSDPSQQYKPGATAITTLFFVERQGAPDDGTILDADTEINGVNFAMAVGCPTCVTMATRGVVEDVRNTMTHELGHTLGLGHTCDDVHVPYDPAQAPVDENGDPIPCCTSQCSLALLPPKVTEATMYNFQAARESSKETLSQDDINAVCAVYPTASDPKVCAPVELSSGGGCSVGGGVPLPGGVIALALAGLVAAARARACSRSRRP